MAQASCQTLFFVNQKKKNIAQSLLGRGLQRIVCDGICHESEGLAGNFTFAI